MSEKRTRKPRYQKSADAVATKSQDPSKTKTAKFFEQLAAHGKVPGGSRGGKKLKAFLEHGEVIREALQAGYSIKDIWSTLKEDGDVDLSYPLFSQYVRTKLELKPKVGFEPVGVGRQEDGPAEPQLAAEQKRHNVIVHGNPAGIPQS